jgi:hypothetical protein
MSVDHILVAGLAAMVAVGFWVLTSPRNQVRLLQWWWRRRYERRDR